MYEGAFEYGNYHGQGCMYDVNGQAEYDGQWYRDKREGIGASLDPATSQMRDGLWIEDEFVEWL